MPESEADSPDSGTQKFQVPLEVRRLMKGFEYPWMIAGGWAVDLHVGRLTRPHNDIEIAIYRKHQTEIYDYLDGWYFQKVIPGNPAVIEHWDRSEMLRLPIHEIHAVNPNSALKALEILLNETEHDEWVNRRNLSIRMPLSRICLINQDGIPYLCPEIVMLYKAKKPKRSDKLDFLLLLKFMSNTQKKWLKNAIERCHPGHPWEEYLEITGIS